MKASCCSNVKSNIVKRIGTAMVVGLRQLNNKIIRHVWARAFSTSPFKMANESASKKMGMSFPHFGTLAIHAGQDPEQWNSRAVVPPISMSSTFKQDAPGVHRGFEYSRSGNPTRNCFEACVAALEGAKHGIATASGLSATMLLTHLLKSGDHILSVDDVYGGTNRYFSQVAAPQMGVEISFVDLAELSKLKSAIKPNTKMVWVETPTNPLLKLVDIQGASEIVHQHEGITLVVDNTFMSSYFQRPLSLGADVVMHSVTKYLNGHSDTVMGVICTNNDELCNKLRFLQNALGPVPSPFDCFLANRGLKTLHLRMRQHQINALAVARFLEKNPRVQRVIYPGLESYPQLELAKKQMTGFGGMVTFFIKGDLENSKQFFKASKLFTLAESLGGFESLTELPAIMTHASVPKDQREILGISDTLIRLSVGLEDTEDLIEDLDQALKKAVPDSLL
ncbi:cystathionine gamma-lyase-like [Acropora millepora]|uniref:cystathionine gamma-lyase-like n=1 Tax=Acropora millepora TaxID=45264 RepID=UPI001CF5A576|nr:cystathionine gamma-lyase-like [Acropora millepora]